MDKRYMISEASKEVGVEPHVLRYWEEELNMTILRNELGHRYYTEEDIQRYKKIKDMKNRGFQLKAIKTVLFNADKGEDLDANLKILESFTENDTSYEDRLELFKGMMGEIIDTSLDAHAENLSKDISTSVKESIIKELNYLFREEEEREEERFRKVDKLLRERQEARREEGGERGIKRWFSKKKEAPRAV